MKSGHLSNRGALALAVLVSAAACGDSTGPVLDYDPAITVGQLDEILEPFDGSYDLLLGLDLAVATLEYHTGSYAFALSARPDDGVGIRSLRSALATPRGAPRPGGAERRTAAARSVAALILPDSLTGRTLVWDNVEGYRVSGLAGAPSDGVRLVLYRMDSSTGYPRLPLVETGYLDITDEDGALVERVGVRAVMTEGADRVAADYTVELTGSGSYAEGWLEVTTQGMFGATAAVDLDITQRLSWSETGDEDELSLEYRYARGQLAVGLDGRAVSAYDAAQWATFEFEMTFRGLGPVVEIDADIRSDGSLEGQILSDGRLAMRIGGYDGQPSFKRPEDRGLSASDVDALERLWVGITDLIWLTDWAASPADLLLLAG